MLNFFKKYLWLIISLAVAFVLLAAVGGRLFFVYKSHAKEQRELDEASGRLDQLYNRATFPSAANIIREKQRLNDLVDEYNELHGLLAAGQVLPQDMEGAEFITFLENTLPRMRERLQVGRVAFPEKYAFGFEDYQVGKMPVPEAIPRLVQQLKIVETICDLLPDAAVTELVAFTREDFEKQAAFTERLQPGYQKKSAQPPAAGIGPAGEGLYTTQHFKMNFRGREGSVLDLLNRLARLPVFVVVTRLEIVNPRAEAAIGGAGPAPTPADQSKTAATAAAPAEEVSRDKRICLGREDVEVKLELDVYNFGPALEFREGMMKKPTTGAVIIKCIGKH